MKITTKIILSIVLIVFVTGTILVAFSANTQKRLIEEQIEKKGSVLAEIIAVSSIIPMLNYDYSSVRLYFDALSKDSDVLSGELLDTNYIVKMHTDIDRLGEVNNPGIIDEDLKSTLVKKETGTDNLVKYEFYSPVLVEEERIGIFHITLTSKSYLNVIKLVWLKMILLGAMSLMIGALLAFFLGNQISKPIKELVKGAESVSGGNFKWDFVTNSNDEVGKLARAFRNMTERLDKNITSRIRNEKMAIVGQLSSVLAHEIRNPLEPIKGSAELLKIYYPEEKQIIKFAGIIQEEVLRLISFIDNFLDFAKPRDPEFRQIDLNTLIDKTFILLEKMIDDKQIRVDISADRNLPPVTGDASMLKQVILNVILNAIQASERKKGLIKVSTGINKSFAELVIKDYGKGIEKVSLDKIFDPFFSTKAEGSGTGLTTSQRIVEQHGGKINVESETGKWTMVQILLPLSVSQEEKIINE